MHAMCLDVYFAFVPGSVQAAKPGVSDEFLSGLFRQIAVTACNVYSANTKLTNFPMWQWVKLVNLENNVRDIGERRAYGDRLARP
jgi:hypothetical protein